MTVLQPQTLVPGGEREVVHKDFLFKSVNRRIGGVRATPIHLDVSRAQQLKAARIHCPDIESCSERLGQR